MSEEKKVSKEPFSFLKNWTFLKKLKQVKHIGLIVAVIFILILLVILFGNFNLFGSSSASTSNASTYTNSLQYSSQMENKLKSLISQIKGSGNVTVMVTVEDNSALLLSSETSKSGVVAVSGNSMVVDKSGQGSPVVIGEVTPKIKGVVVVSSGASDTNVRLNILRAVQTLLELNESKIQILIGN